MTRLGIATASTRDSRSWRNETATWAELVAWAEHPATVKECGGVIYGTLTEDRGPRTRENIATRSALSLDADKARPDFLDRLREALAGVRYLVHETHSSTPDAPRWRVIVPLAAPVDPETFTLLSRAILRALGSTKAGPGEFDWIASTRPEQFMWRPARPDGKAACREEPGEPLDLLAWAVEMDEEEAEFRAELAARASREHADREATPEEIEAAGRVLRKQVQRVADALPGERNETVASALWTVAMLGKAGCFDLEEAIAALRDAAPFGDGYTPAEFEASLAGAIEKAPAELPRPRDEWRDESSPAEDFEALPEEPGETAAGFERDVLKELRSLRVREAARDRFWAEQGAAAWQGLPEPLELYEAMKEPPTVFRVEGLIPGDGHTSLVAQAKVGKTTMLGNLSRSMLTGEDFLGRFGVHPLDGNVVMLNFEMPGRMLAGWYADMGLPRGRFHLLNLRGWANPFASTEGRAELVARVRHLAAEAVILDPFGLAYTGESQNDAQEVRAWLKGVDDLLRSAGVSDVIVATHTGWENSRVRGSTALKDHPDSQVTLTREGDSRYLEAVGRDVNIPRGTLTMDPETRLLTFTSAAEIQAGKEAQVEAQRAQDREAWDETKAEAIRQLLSAHPDGLSKNQIHEAVHGNRPAVLRLVGLMVEDGELQAVKGRYALADDL